MEIFIGIAIYLAALGAFFILGVIIHELGHLVFGLMTGYKFVSFRVFFLVFFKEDGKVKAKGAKWIFGGQCLMAPPGDLADFRFVWYNIGGGLVNLVAALIFAAAYAVTFNIIFLAAAIANTLLVILSLVPLKYHYIPNDGMNVIEASKSDDGKRGFYLALFVTSETSAGKRLRDFGSELFALDESADTGNCFAAYIIICRAARHYDMGEYEKSAEALSRLDVNNLQPYYANTVRFELMYHYTVHSPDSAKAKKLYNAAHMKTHFKLSALLPGITRTLSAYEYFVNSDKEKGKELLEKARKEAEEYPNTGIRAMEAEYCNYLEEKFEEGTCSNS